MMAINRTIFGIETWVQSAKIKNDRFLSIAPSLELKPDIVRQCTAQWDLSIAPSLELKHKNHRQDHQLFQPINRTIFGIET